jgi:NAD(P)-dependent dehydrogenase (short-subunit alcohol dehydrogenase family)
LKPEAIAKMAGGPQMEDKDAIALVTGGARGIGRATALAYAHKGCHVAIADLHDDDGEKLAKEIKQLGQRALYLHCDVSDPRSVASMMTGVKQEFGQLDYACNNAGIEGDQAPTAESSLENFDRVMAVNLRGLFICMGEELALMLERGKGSIINVASIAGLIGFPKLPAYCASKGGVVQLTRTAAIEYAEQGIRINAVCPGAVQTEMIDRITGKKADVVEQFRTMHPMKRMATPEEVANTIVWLSSKEASFITGQAIAVDGGYVAA